MRYRSSLNCCCGLMIFSRIMALDRNLISVPCTIYAPGNTLSVDLVFSLSVHYSVCPLLCLSVCAKTNCNLGHNFRIILVTSSIFHMCIRCEDSFSQYQPWWVTDQVWILFRFMYGFVIMNYRWSSSFVWFHIILKELCPF